MSLALENVVDRVIGSYLQICALDDQQLVECRIKVGGYISKLTAAGRKNPEELTLYGLAYLKELREGPDPHFSGC